MLLQECHAGVKWSDRHAWNRSKNYRQQNMKILSAKKALKTTVVPYCPWMKTVWCIHVSLSLHSSVWKSACLPVWWRRCNPIPLHETSNSIHPADLQYRWTQSFTFLNKPVLFSGKLRGLEHRDDLKGIVYPKMTLCHNLLTLMTFYHLWNMTVRNERNLSSLFFFHFYDVLMT